MAPGELCVDELLAHIHIATNLEVEKVPLDIIMEPCGSINPPSDASLEPELGGKKKDALQRGGRSCRWGGCAGGRTSCRQAGFKEEPRRRYLRFRGPIAGGPPRWFSEETEDRACLDYSSVPVALVQPIEVVKPKRPHTTFALSRRVRNIDDDTVGSTAMGSRLLKPPRPAHKGLKPLSRACRQKLLLRRADPDQAVMGKAERCCPGLVPLKPWAKWRRCCLGPYR
ncbi:uncharacterized protein [Triticum aestivum]|uniref:uncharacterized protein isoform X1 n=1 Tax=Triticum aestivum TaxID=4565 RepID=UPI001D01F950|nr:uncharacterized protein LOC123078661 isoform X1 [Triticum aestivum]